MREWRSIRAMPGRLPWSQMSDKFNSNAITTYAIIDLQWYDTNRTISD